MELGGRKSITPAQGSELGWGIHGAAQPTLPLRGLSCSGGAALMAAAPLMLRERSFQRGFKPCRLAPSLEGDFVGVIILSSHPHQALAAEALLEP